MSSNLIPTIQHLTLNIQHFIKDEGIVLAGGSGIRLYPITYGKYLLSILEEKDNTLKKKGEALVAYFIKLLFSSWYGTYLS